jgi:hypothetical protein
MPQHQGWAFSFYFIVNINVLAFGVRHVFLLYFSISSGQ